MQKVESLLAEYRFSEAAEVVYHSLWDDVADWYIEASKQAQNDDMLAWVLDTTLRITHPFAPFVTETIWQTLPWYSTALISASWPAQLEYDEIAAAEFTRLQELVSEVRFVANELPGNSKYDLLFGEDSLLADNTSLIKQLVGFHIKDVRYTDQPRGMRLANSGREAWLDIDEKTLYEHEANLEVRIAEGFKELRTLEARLSNPNYVEKAPTKLVEETRENIEKAKARIERLRAELDIIKT